MPDSGRASWRGDVVTALVIGAFALFPRFVLLSATPISAPLYDMAEYWERAVFILEHGRLYDNSTRMPGYPAALSLVLTLTGDGPWLGAARLFNAAAGVVAAMLTYWLARRTAGRGASFVAAAVVALYPSLLIYTALIATEAVVAVPLLGALIASTYHSPRAAVVAGVCTAAATLVRPAGIAMLPAVLVTVFWSGLRSMHLRRQLVLVLLAFSVVMVPWWMHNLQLHGRFVPLDASGGINMAIGNHPQASGTYRYREASHLYALGLTPVERATPDTSDAAASYAVRYIREQPGAFVRRVPAKLAALFALEGREIAFVYSLGFFGPQDAATVTAWALALASSFPPLVAAALAGLAVRQGIAPRVGLPAVVWIAASVTMHTLTFGDPRYHLPMVPVLAVLATGIARASNGFHRRRLLGSAIVLALLVLAWTRHADTYRRVLPQLTAPDGWQSQIAYDDLL